MSQAALDRAKTLEASTTRRMVLGPIAAAAVRASPQKAAAVAEAAVVVARHGAATSGVVRSLHGAVTSASERQIFVRETRDA